MVSFDLLGPLPETKNDNVYVFFIADLLSRHAEGCAITNDEKTARGWASRIIMDNCIPRWGCPHTFPSDRGTQIISETSRAVYETLGVVKKFISSYHPRTNGTVGRLNHTLCQTLSYPIADDHNNWEEMLIHAIAAHNNNVRQ